MNQSKTINGWTSARRRQQSEAIHRWKPWRYSTGPRTEEGKARTKLNGQVHGARSAAMDALSAAIASSNRMLQGLYSSFTNRGND